MKRLESILFKRHLSFFENQKVRESQLRDEQGTKLEKIEECYRPKLEKVKANETKLLNKNSLRIEEFILGFAKGTSYEKWLKTRNGKDGDRIVKFFAWNICTRTQQEYLIRKSYPADPMMGFRFAISDRVIKAASLTRRDICEFVAQLEKDWNKSCDLTFYFPTVLLNNPDTNWYRTTGVMITVFTKEDAERWKYDPETQAFN
jgi:hypothetical protein